MSPPRRSDHPGARRPRPSADLRRVGRAAGRAPRARRGRRLAGPPGARVSSALVARLPRATGQPRRPGSRAGTSGPRSTVAGGRVRVGHTRRRSLVVPPRPARLTRRPAAQGSRHRRRRPRRTREHHAAQGRWAPGARRAPLPGTRDHACVGLRAPGARRHRPPLCAKARPRRPAPQPAVDTSSPTPRSGGPCARPCRRRRRRPGRRPSRGRPGRGGRALGRPCGPRRCPPGRRPTGRRRDGGPTAGGTRSRPGVPPPPTT